MLEEKFSELLRMALRYSCSSTSSTGMPWIVGVTVVGDGY